MDTKLDSFKKRRRKSRHKKAMSKCGKKQCHKDRDSAMATIRRMIQKSIKKKNPIVSQLNAYQCEHCNQWHVGSNKNAINWDLIEAMRKPS